MIFGSLFAGVGGFDMALESAGMEVVWQVEKDKQARSVLRRHWPDVDLYEDVHDVGIRPRPKRQGEGDRTTHPRVQPTDNDCEADGGGTGGQVGRRGAGELVRPDLICGGFPCQDYSVAGKRGGLAGDRGGLWWQMHRIISELMPTWVIGENVPGLLSSNGGRDFATILSSLVGWDVPTPPTGWGNAGVVQGRPDHYGVVFAVLDSQYFGVAQRRRRVFIVGHSGGVPRPEILALSEGLFGHPAPSRETGARIAEGSLARALGQVGGGNDYGANKGTLIANALPTKYRADPHEGTDTIVAFDTTQITSKANRSNPKPGDPCHPLAAGAHAPAVAYSTKLHNTKSNQSGKFYEEYTPGLHHSSPPPALVATVPRRLTPTECERLQAWPDDWTRYGSERNKRGHIYQVTLKDGPRYRMCGNGVTASVVEWIGRRIMTQAKLELTGTDG